MKSSGVSSIKPMRRVWQRILWWWRRDREERELEEERRDVWRPVWLDHLGQDLRYAFVTLTRNPGHAIGAIVSLGLGIGAATAVFSAVEGLVLNPYPYSGADRIVVMSQAEGAGPSRRTFLTGDQARLF